MESKYQEEESIGKELDSTEVLKNNELEPTTEPPPEIIIKSLKEKKKDEIHLKEKNNGTSQGDGNGDVKPFKKKGKDETYLEEKSSGTSQDDGNGDLRPFKKKKKTF